MAAAAMIPMPSPRPMWLRAPASAGTCFSAIKSPPEESDPQCEHHENPKTRIDQPSRANIGIKSRPDKQPSSEQSHSNPNQCAEHPRRKERTDDINLWSHRAPFVVPDSRSELDRN